MLRADAVAGIALVAARLESALQQQLDDAGPTERIRPDSFYANVERAVRACVDADAAAGDASSEA